MSQVVSIRVPEHYEEACTEFQREASVGGSNEGITTSQDFTVFYDESLNEIRCEGNYPDSIFSALVNIRDKFDGKLFYEGEEWHEEINESNLVGKIMIVLAVIFFPITLVYLLIRIVFWIPFKVWKATR